MITYHSCHEMETGECSTMSYWTDEEAWISFIMLQSGHGLNIKNWEIVKPDRRRKSSPGKAGHYFLRTALMPLIGCPLNRRRSPSI